jgi:hypothetical protein
MRGNRFLFPMAMPSRLVTLPRWPNWYWRNVENWAKNTDAHDLLLFSKIVNYASIFSIILIFIASLAGWFFPAMTTHFQVNTSQLGLKIQDNDQFPKWGLQFFDVIPVSATTVPRGVCRRATFVFHEEPLQKEVTAKPAELAITVYSGQANSLTISLGHAEKDLFTRFGELSCLVNQPFPKQFSLKLDRIVSGELSAEAQASNRNTSQINSIRLQGRVSALGTDAGSGVYGPNQLQVIKSGLIESKVPTWPFASGEIASETTVGPLDALSFVQNVRGVSQPALIALDITKAENGLMVSGFVVADEVIVKRFGAQEGASVKLRPTLLHRLRAQEEWLLLIALFLSMQFLRVSWEAYVRSFWVQSVAVRSENFKEA